VLLESTTSVAFYIVDSAYALMSYENFKMCYLLVKCH